MNADEYIKLKNARTAKVSVLGLPASSFTAVLLPLPLTTEEKSRNTSASYEVLFRIEGLDIFVSEGGRVKVR